MKYITIPILFILLFVLTCTPTGAISKNDRTLAGLHKFLSSSLTKEELISRWGEPDSRGSGRDLLYYELHDGTTVTLFYINNKLIGVSHKGKIIVEYPSK